MFAALLVYFSYLLASYRGLPNVLIVMAVLIFLFHFVTSRTTIGRRVYALGGNEKAAKLSGIKTERLAFYTFVNMFLARGLCYLISVDSISITNEFYSEVSQLRIPLWEDASLSISAVIAIVVLLAAVFIAHCTPFGRTVYAVGGHEQREHPSRQQHRAHHQPPPAGGHAALPLYRRPGAARYRCGQRRVLERL